MSDETWKTKRDPKRIYRGWATVLILPDSPHYPTLTERAQSGKADAREFRYDEHGFWVAPTWVWK
jgi:hypothetical protein